MQVSSTWPVVSLEPVRAFSRPMSGTSGRRNMNHSIATADRNTHLKIVIVALVAAIMVATVGIAAKFGTSGVELAGVDPKPTGVVKVGKPVVWTERAESAIR